MHEHTDIAAGIILAALITAAFIAGLYALSEIRARRRVQRRLEQRIDSYAARMKPTGVCETCGRGKL